MLLRHLTDTAKKILIIGPHPDDVEFSCGRLILRRKGLNTHVVCMTDGRKGQDGTDVKKVLDEEDYVGVRIQESKKALSELRIKDENILFIKAPDQDLVFNPYVIDRLYLMIRRTKPDFILIPPWEGAHPDHDAAHLFSIISSKNISFQKDRMIEYGSYNNFQGQFRVQKFIPKDTQVHTLTPSPNEQKRWLNIMKIFKSQKNQQKHYIPKSKDEVYRVLPKYDYDKLPHCSKNSQVLRQLLFYPLARRILPKQEKLFYETWTSINPEKIKTKLNKYVKDYGI